MNISSNISSISAQQSLMNTSAHNVANVNTDRYVPNGATDNGSQKSQTDLAKEIPNQIVAQEATASNVSAIKTQDEMLGSLLDIKA